jgi:hypothetical protein
MNQVIDKQHLHQICLQMIQQKITETQATISAAGISAQAETKSTAGDKHDTARAMAHLEQEKYAAVLAQQKAAEDLLLRINPAKVSPTVGAGSVVVSTMGTFYIAAPLGKCESGGQEIFVLSSSSPLAVAIRGLKAGDSFSMAGKPQRIIALF